MKKASLMHLPALVIPAYKPDEKLLGLINTVKANQPRMPVIVVNDGSGEDYETIFSELLGKNITVLTHAMNRGKGAALKTAFQYWLNQPQENKTRGIITADADGQHTIEDINKVISAYQQNPNTLYIGARNFSQSSIPWRSRFGNKITSFIFRRLLDFNLSDTQSGLRALPYAFIQPCLGITSSQYDFEFEMLLLAKELHIPIKEVPISTIYIEDNVSSHFNPIVDSFKIYFVFFRFAAISITSACIDFFLFLLTFELTANIAYSVIVGRLVSGTFNFINNKKYTFRYNGTYLNTGIKYILLAIFLAICSYTGIRILYDLGFHIYLSKILVETLLYFVSFIMQKKLVFPNAEML